MRKHVFSLTLISSLLAVPAFAATTTGNLTVKAVVQESCLLDSSAGSDAGNAVIDFGTITSLAANVDADTTTAGGAALSVICSNGTTYDVSADLGANPTGTQRRMAGATDYLPYDLYADTGRSTLVGNGVTFFSGTGNGLSQDIEIYGRIPAGTQLPAADNYLDTVVLTVTY